MNIIERYKRPTPKFFRIIRNIGMVLITIAGAVLSVPDEMPAPLVSIAAYALVVGTVASTVSQAVVSDLPSQKKRKHG